MEDKSPQNESMAEQLDTCIYTKNVGKVQQKWRN